MKRTANVIGGLFTVITGLVSIMPQLSKDLGKIMDGVYVYVPQLGFGLVFIGLVLFLWFINSPKRENTESSFSLQDIDEIRNSVVAKEISAPIKIEEYNVKNGVGKQEAKEIKNYFGGESKKKETLNLKE